jgi:predicted outer membrane protein
MKSGPVAATAISRQADMKPRLTKWIVLALLGLAALSTAAEKPRLAVLTDIGGDPDDRQSMIRVMVYANEFEIEALVASAAGTPGELKQSIDSSR